MKEVRKRRWGDRKDGYKLKDLDVMHVVTPFILPRRTDNEAVLNECFDFEKALAYIKLKNDQHDSEDYKWTIFHFICSALAKTIYLRPKLNYFVSGYRMFERNELSFSFVIKKRFEDSSHEALAKIVIDENSEYSAIEQVYRSIKQQVFSCRREKKEDKTTSKMNFTKKLPRFVVKFCADGVRLLDYWKLLPTSYTKEDPYFSTVFMSNLGSIKMNANYHHLVNYGTNSFFVCIGEMKKQPIFHDDGTFEMKNCVNMSMTIDERIADGVYFAKSIKLLRYIIENPKILDEKIDTPIDLDLSLYNERKTDDEEAQKLLK